MGLIFQESEIRMSIEIKKEGHIAVMTLNEGENRLNLNFVTQFLAALDSVEKETDATVLVVNAAHEKIFSNGVDLDWMMMNVEKNDKAIIRRFIETMMTLFKRILISPMTTIAAITGHAFAGGAIMTCYFDFRFMRSDRGFMCFPEIDLGIPFFPGMMAATKKAIPRYKLEEMVLTGKRMTAKECLDHHIITKACPMEDLMNDVMAFAKTQNKRREIVYALKEELNRDVVYVLDHEDPPVIESGRFSV